MRLVRIEIEVRVEDEGELRLAAARDTRLDVSEWSPAECVQACLDQPVPGCETLGSEVLSDEEEDEDKVTPVEQEED